jgi:FlaG/FlaF family flagellin (archaellin)
MATLLMVAITVVFAAVLYVIVMTYGDFIPRDPLGTFTCENREATDAERLTFSAFESSPRFDSCRLRIAPPGDAPNARAAKLWNITDISAPYVYDSTITLIIDDLGSEGRISQGDFVTITWTSTNPLSGEWTVSLLYAPSNNQIAMIAFTL